MEAVLFASEERLVMIGNLESRGFFVFLFFGSSSGIVTIFIVIILIYEATANWARESE